VVACTYAQPKCMSRINFGDCGCLEARDETFREIETRFWSIVDADGLSGLPSDMWSALETLARAARNRDMWKGQCERQAEALSRLNAEGADRG